MKWTWFQLWVHFCLFICFAVLEIKLVPLHFWATEYFSPLYIPNPTGKAQLLVQFPSLNLERGNIGCVKLERQVPLLLNEKFILWLIMEGGKFVLSL